MTKQKILLATSDWKYFEVVFKANQDIWTENQYLVEDAECSMQTVQFYGRTQVVQCQET